jgi:hypothetical protein
MKNILILSCFLFNAGLIHAEKSFLGRFLNAAVKHQQEQGIALKKRPSIMPVFSDAELRVRNRSYDFEGQRYSLKLEPRGFGETRALKKYLQSNREFEKIHNQYNFNENLLLRYIYFIDMLERKALANSYRDLILVYEDRIKVMEELQNSSEFDLTTLIKAEKELAKLISENIEEGQEVQIANEYIAQECADSLGGEIDTIGLKSVPQIKKEIEAIDTGLSEEANIYLKDLKSELSCSENRYKLAGTQNRKPFSFFEFSYDFGSYNEELVRRSDFKDYNLNNAIMFEVGIKIPGFSSNEDDLMRYQMDYSSKISDYRSLQREMAAKIKKDISDIKAYIERYELMSRRETESDAEASLKKYMQLSGVDPLVLLSIQESVIKNRFEKEKVYFSILRNLIYVVDVAGKLSERPIINFLFSHNEIVVE